MVVGAASRLRCAALEIDWPSYMQLPTQHSWSAVRLAAAIPCPEYLHSKRRCQISTHSQRANLVISTFDQAIPDLWFQPAVSEA